MLTQIDILSAIKDILASKFGYPIYLDEVKEGFESPCFFLKAIRTTNRDNKCNQLNTIMIYITFFSEKGTLTAEELYNLQDSLTQYFISGFPVKKDNRHLQTLNLNHEIDGEDSDIINFSFDIRYYDYLYEKDTDQELMNQLHLNERLTHNGLTRN